MNALPLSSIRESFRNWCGTLSIREIVFNKNLIEQIKAIEPQLKTEEEKQ